MNSNIDYLNRKAESRLIPQKSEDAYKKEYDKFIKWMEEQKESGKLSDMIFLYFQLSKEGNPVNDLSYFLYSSVSNETLDELDYFLKVYYNSLSETLKLFNLHSENIYTFKVLKGDWKQYCHLGFSMEILIWKTKCEEDIILDFTDFKDDVENMNEAFMTVKYDQVMLKKRTRDLILHMYNNDFL